jgi:alkanesulfonate monooxygenase SsuD/methylene tetrahydromethanopterin reductase-like flavin-dependent oxidoreductase (luciferase family)
MKFGVFDHLDKGCVSIQEHFENRLKLAEIYDRAGFYAYHIAEHHGTPLGLASSPSVFLSALAQRTKQLRFGPLVYTLSLTHPLKIIEEVCMLDQMSGGRLELGIGRGSSPYEMGFFGVGADKSSSLYIESYDVVMMGLKEGVLNFEGEHFNFKDVPIELKCIQKPTPPIWYGMSQPHAVPWAAEHHVNIVCNGPGAPVKAITSRYEDVWGENFGSDPDCNMPLMGLGRHIVIADSYEKAYSLGRKGFDKWYQSLQYLWRLNGNPMTKYSIPEDYDAAVDGGMVLVGTSSNVSEQLHVEIEKSGVNYILTRFAFGDLTLDESKFSLESFENEVMPLFLDFEIESNLG